MKKLVLVLAMLILAIAMVGCAEDQPAQVAQPEAPAAEAETPVEQDDPDEPDAVTPEEPAMPPAELRYMTWVAEDMRPEYYNFLMERAAEFNIDFEWHFVPNEQLDMVLNTQMAAKQGPDILETGGQFIGQARAGFFMDITGQPFVDRFADGPRESFTYNGQVFAVPMTAFYAGIFYNREIFAEFDISIPNTWAEFQEIAGILEGSGIRPFVIGGQSFGDPAWPMFGVLNTTFYSNPANFAFDGEFAAGRARVSDAWYSYLAEYWVPLLELGFFTGELNGLDTEQARREFALGNAAMWQATSGNITAVEEISPDLDFGIFPYPTPDGSTGWLVGTSGNGVGINPDTNYPEHALLMLDAISTEEAQHAMWLTLGGPSTLLGVEFEIHERAQLAVQPLSEGNLYATWVSWPYAGQLIEDLSRLTQLIFAGEVTLAEFLYELDERNIEILRMVGVD